MKLATLISKEATDKVFMPAHKDTKTPAGQLVFDRYPYLKHGSIAVPKLTFEEYWNKQGFDTDSYMLRLKPEFKLCWDAAQENK
jgi:hypothetical protein